MALSTKNVSAPRRVVIVDDSRTMQALLDNAFGKRTDFEVVGFCSDGKMASEMIRNLRPDIVTIDLAMPYIDGAALLTMIADLKTVCKIIVSDTPTNNIMLSSKLMEVGASICLGKTEFITNPDKFFSKINAVAAHVNKGATRHLRTINSSVNHSRRTDQISDVIPGTAFPIPFDEQARIRLVREKRLANSERERQFDLVTRHVAKVTEFPVCLLTFMERDTQWIKSASGMEAESTPRQEAFCNYTIAQGEAFVVKNAATDERFSHFSAVIDAPSIRCYAGHPVKTSDDVNVGALCVIDNRVRTVSKNVLDQLAGMSEIVAEMIDQRPFIVD